MEILIIDVGGQSVKLWHTSHEHQKQFPSGTELTPERLSEKVHEIADWQWEAVALGLPCRVSKGRAVEDPANLGPGWMGFNFAAAFGQPVRIMNDAALQALGSYDEGRMLFIGLGTAVGSAYIADHTILSLDLGQLQFGDDRLFELFGDEGYDRLGRERWQATL